MKFTIAYTLLFLYIIAAIMFWGYSLRKQNIQFYELEIEKLNLKLSDKQSLSYQAELAKIEDKKKRRIKQYWGEETTNLFVILLSASVVYFAYFRQQQLNKLQKNFMLSVTHELKTPIAGIKLNMQTLDKHKLDEEKQRKLIKSSVEETNRLSDLCNNILIATQLEDNNKAIYSDQIDMIALTKGLIEEMKNRYPTFLLTLKQEVEEFALQGDETLWRMVLNNLIENARKYSDIDTPVIVAIKRSGHTITWSVEDQGIGIADEEKARVFDKFYRIGNENTRKSKGTGLGLYIVKKIVSLYKYDISVRNNTPCGSIFEVRFDHV
jgi:two-component system sensor histidine kinase CiaH